MEQGKVSGNPALFSFFPWCFLSHHIHRVVSLPAWDTSVIYLSPPPFFSNSAHFCVKNCGFS